MRLWIKMEFRQPLDWNAKRPAIAGAVKKSTYLALEHMVEAIRQPKSGRVYRRLSTKEAARNWKRSKGPRPDSHYISYTSSAPGEAPAIRPGFHLGGHLWEMQTRISGLSGEVYGTSYGMLLEMGTKEMDPRPFVQPAIDYVKPILEEDLRKILQGGAA